MGWEKRRSTNYYYAKRKQPDGKVVSIYLGKGERAKKAAREVEARATASLTARFEQRAVEGYMAKAEPLLTEFSERLEGLISTQLRQAGFHKYRGQWRKKRRGKDSGCEQSAPDSN